MCSHGGVDIFGGRAHHESVPLSLERPLLGVRELAALLCAFRGHRGHLGLGRLGHQVLAGLGQQRPRAAVEDAVLDPALGEARPAAGVVTLARVEERREAGGAGTWGRRR